MGYPYYELIPAAILLNKPGLNKYKYLRELNKTHHSQIHQWAEKDPWDSYADKIPYTLEDLARLFRLEDSQKFMEFQQPSLDENGLDIRAPQIIPASWKEKDYKFEVVVHEKNILEEPKIEESYSWGKLNVGDVWTEVMLGAKGIVLKIFKETEYPKKKECNKCDSDGPSPEYIYEMMIRPFHGEGRREYFKSGKALYKKWPQFHPDFVYDWTKEKGEFHLVLSNSKLEWIMKNQRYYFDQDSFDRMSAGFFHDGSFGYTDLISTSEAIKNRAWKLLSYKGGVHIPQFCRDFPKSAKRYERAIWDSHTSLYAKKKGMTHTELLRLRIQ